jgi:Phage integrase family
VSAEPPVRPIVVATRGAQAHAAGLVDGCLEVEIEERIAAGHIKYRKDGAAGANGKNGVNGKGFATVDHQEWRAIVRQVRALRRGRSPALDHHHQTRPVQHLTTFDLPLNRRRLLPVARLAAQLKVPGGVPSTLAVRDDVVELQSLAGPAVDASPFVAAPHFMTHTLGDRLAVSVPVPSDERLRDPHPRSQILQRDLQLDREVLADVGHDRLLADVLRTLHEDVDVRHLNTGILRQVPKKLGQPAVRVADRGQQDGARSRRHRHVTPPSLLVLHGLRSSRDRAPLLLHTSYPPGDSASDHYDRAKREQRRVTPRHRDDHDDHDDHGTKDPAVARRPSPRHDANLDASLPPDNYPKVGNVPAGPLRWCDVDFANRVVHIRRSYTHGEVGTPKSGRVRSVPLIDQAAKALDDLSTRGSSTGPDDLVFVEGELGDYLDDWRLRRRFQAALDRAEIKRLRLHDLRHTFGTIAVRAFPLTDVKAYMGHADIQTTMRYVHHVPQGDAAAKLTRVVASEESPLAPTTGDRTHTTAAGDG